MRDTRKLTSGGVTGTAEWNDSDKCWHGKIKGLVDLVMFKGRNFDELRENFVIAVEDWHNTRTAKMVKK